MTGGSGSSTAGKYLPVASPDAKRQLVRGWHYDSSNNRIAGVGDFDGDGREEFVVTSPWGIGLLSLLGDSFWCPDLRAYGSTIGNWFLQENDGIVGIGNFTRSPGRELLIRRSAVLSRQPKKV